MTYGKIWQRYLWAEMAKVFVFFIVMLYALYVLVDYSAHIKLFQRYSIDMQQMALYYLAHLFRRLQILVPFALLLATVSVLCRLNMRRELLAWQVGGFSRWKIMQPILLFAIACCGLIYANFQYLEPLMLPHIDAFESRYFHHNLLEVRQQHLHQITLSDQSKIVYLHYDAAQRRFYDVFWIRSVDEIYHMKYLQPAEPSPLGFYVDCFQRDVSGALLLQSSAEQMPLSSLRLQEQAIKQQQVPVENYSLTELGTRVIAAEKSLSPSRRDEEQTMFFFKLLLPWLNIWVVLIATPLCMHFDRKFSSFQVYGKSLFYLVFFFTSLNAAVILGDSGSVSAWLIVPAVFFLFFLPCTFRFLRCMSH